MRLKQTLAVLAVITLAVFGMQAPAMAASGTYYPPTGFSYGEGYYHVDYTTDQLAVSATAYGNLPAGWCITTYLDISRASGVGQAGTHYDVRAARTCQPGSARSSSMQYEGATYGIDIITLNKLIVCAGPLNQRGNCNEIRGDIMTIDPVFNSNKTCSRSWTRSATGTPYHFNGGDSWECGS